MESLRPEEVVFRTNSDSKSLIIVFPDRMVHAKKGVYGGYVLHPKDFGIDANTLAEMISSDVLAFFIEPKKDELKKDELPDDIKNTIDQYISKLPKEVADEFRKYANVEIINYEYTEVQPIVEKITEKYIVLDFEPKRGGMKLSAKAVRLRMLWQGSRRYPCGEDAGKLLKEWQLKYPDNEIVQNNMYAKNYLNRGRDSILYFKIILEAPKELVPSEESEKPEVIEDLDVDVEKVAEKILSAEEVELEMPTAVREISAPAPTAPAKPELVKVYLLKFKLPSKYLVQKVKYKRDGEGFLEIRDFSEKERVVSASALEGTRRRAYEKINREFVFIESYGLWVAVSEDAVKKAEEIARWLRKELMSIRINADNYYVKAIPVYLEPADGKELLHEAYRLLYSEVRKIKEKIKEAEEEKKKKALKRLEQQLQYKEKLLESLKNYIKEIFG